MSAFFIVADHKVVGPLTGIELREAALAGVLAPDALVGGSPQGPWHSATQVGLFDEKKVPLPHPPDVVVPLYRVRGTAWADQGPFKLRELIGFASRGMLPLEASFCAVASHSANQPWKPLRQLRILVACVSGDLVLIDSAGRVCLRTKDVLQGAESDRWQHGYRAPMELTVHINPSQSISAVKNLSTFRQEDDASAIAVNVPVEVATVRGADSTEMPPLPTRQPLVLDKKFRDQSQPRSRWRVELPVAMRTRRTAGIASVALTCTLIAVLVPLVLQQWNRSSIDHSMVVGSWIHATGSDNPNFGVSFDETGHCVIFNANGSSWTGSYDWPQREGSWGSSAVAPGLKATIDEPEPGHPLDAIRESDGYIRLTGFVKDPPVIDGHEVRDLFVRRRGDGLQLGYLTSVEITSSEKHLTAAWIPTERFQSAEASDVIAKLKSIPEESGGADEAFRSVPVLADAIAAAASDQGNSGKGSPAYSNTVNGSFLLKLFGVPDEARRLYPYEAPQIPLGPDFEHSQLVRYQDVTLMLSPNGEIQFVRVARQATPSSRALTSPAAPG